VLVLADARPTALLALAPAAALVLADAHSPALLAQTPLAVRAAAAHLWCLPNTVLILVLATIVPAVRKEGRATAGTGAMPPTPTHASLDAFAVIAPVVEVEVERC